jgi:hypothetical protein
MIPGLSPIPTGVYWNEPLSCFFDMNKGFALPADFQRYWFPRRAEFPKSRIYVTHGARLVSVP